MLIPQIMTHTNFNFINHELHITSYNTTNKKKLKSEVILQTDKNQSLPNLTHQRSIFILTEKIRSGLDHFLIQNCALINTCVIIYV